MKKLFLSLALLSCMCIGANAQTKVIFNNGPVGLNWKFKRSFIQGTTLVVDFVVENNTGKDIVEFFVNMDGFDEQGHHFDIVAYDDEGNMYSGYEKIRINIANQGNGNAINFPAGQMVKVRIQIIGIDEFATKITSFMAPVRSSYWNNWAVLRVSNISIPRE